MTGFLVTLPLSLRQPDVKTFGLVKFSDWFRQLYRNMQSDMVVLLIMSSLFLSWIGLFTWAVQLTRISSTELQRTGSVRSSSAFSNQLLKAEAFLANNRNKSSTLNTKNNEDCKRKTENDDDNNSSKTLASNLCFELKSQGSRQPRKNSPSCTDPVRVVVVLYES